MKGQLRYRHLGRSAVALLLAAAASLGNAQAFNVDLDIFTGTAAQGNGAPSSSFGAAAGQIGLWNRASVLLPYTLALLDVAGVKAGAIMTVDGTFGSGIGFLNPTNTGDYALLLNDAGTVGTVVQGGSRRYSFSGLSEGRYLVYTYAVVPQGVYTEVPVRVEEAVTNNTQVVTGPMPGNSFEYLITHSIHDVFVDNGTFSIEVIQKPGTQVPYEINGFQVVPVPETNSFVILACSCAVAYGAKRRLGSRGG